MVNRCVNPHCRLEFKVLSSGDLYAHERHPEATEFYWLCSTCAAHYDLYLDRSGRVSIRARGTTHHHGLPPHGDSKLRLVTRTSRSVPRLQTIPSSEQSSSFAAGAGPFFPESSIRGGLDH